MFKNLRGLRTYISVVQAILAAIGALVAEFHGAAGWRDILTVVAGSGVAQALAGLRAALAEFARIADRAGK